MFEIEKKYLLTESEAQSWIAIAQSKKELVQGYLVVDERDTPKLWRIRTVDDGLSRKALWTFKQATEDATVRVEEEAEMDYDQAMRLLAICGQKLEKTRHEIPYKGLVFEVDVFKNNLEGLVLLEIELSDKNQWFEVPPGLSLGVDVTDVEEYRNDNLAQQKKKQVKRKP